MGILWGLCRLCFFFFPALSKGVVYGILIVGFVEAIIGLGQLYGFFPSGHQLFKTTGTFLNPGPYGGFIALMFPLTLHYWLYFRKRKKILRYVFLFVGMVCLLVFPATLSRTAWGAAAIGCMLVAIYETGITDKLKDLYQKYRKRAVLCIVLFCLLSGGVIYGIYQFKKDSANGRLFIWKITALAIQDASLKGVGLGGFPAAYAQSQINYFKEKEASAIEKHVAGSPEYAFNEYLRIFLEQGIAGGILFLFLTSLIIRRGIKNKHTGAAGSFLCLSVFAIASYPYYLWEFLVVWVLLATICASQTKPPSSESSKNRRISIFALFAVFILIASLSVCVAQWYFYHRASKEWEKIHPFYTMKAYSKIIDDYIRLYPQLNHDPKFVFEYAVTLNAEKRHEQADSILSRGLQISCDPMFYNVKGRNYHEMGAYRKAEACYMNATYLIPERIYPYYLLTKLYADSAAGYPPERMQWAASIVLKKEAKVHSTAIDEMRDEVRKILKEKI
ncbi:O-antigen ligase family protein [Tannerella forsythia]